MENKTAVDFMASELKKRFKRSMSHLTDSEWCFEMIDKISAKALEIEKQQIVDARVTAPILPVPDKESYIEEAEEYYSETYKAPIK